MRTRWMGSILLLFFILEGTLLHWIIPRVWMEQGHLTTYFVVVIILYISLYVHRYAGLVYGLIYGFLQDAIYYGPMLGVHAFSIGLTAYLTGLVFQRLPRQALYIGFALFLGLWTYEWLLYGVYRLFGVTEIFVSVVWLKYMLPSVLFNMMFALAIYVPAYAWLYSSELQRDDEDGVV